MVSPAQRGTSANSIDIKIVFTGTMGAGKTTAIRNISAGGTLSTEVPMREGPTTEGKTTTTVGLDYGECPLSEGVVLKLFGTPGQERFRFMWEILARGAWGLVVLVDNSRADPIGDAEHFLDAFTPHMPPHRTVIGVGRLGTHPWPRIDDYVERFAARGGVIPVIDVDVRRDEDVRLLLSVLVSMAEVNTNA